MRALTQLALLVLLCGLAAALPGSNPCSRGPGHWCSSLAAARSCSALAHCAQLWSRSANPHPDPADATKACAACRLLADDLVRMAAEGVDRLRTAGAAACGLVTNADSARACRRLLSGPIDLPELLAAGLQPGKACALAGQCRQQPLQPMPTFTHAGSCNVCPSVLEAVGAAAIRADRTAAQTVTQLRLRVCPSLPSLRERLMCRQITGRRDLYSIMLQLAEGTSPIQACSRFHLCSSAPFIGHPVQQLMRLQTTKAKKPAASIQCQVCEQLVTEARQMLRDGRTQTEIENFIETIVCNALPQAQKDQCVNNVKEYGPILFQLLASEMDPQTVCEAIGACGKTKVTGESMPKSKLVKASPQCLLCEFVMREVDQQLGQNATQAEIEAALQQVCNILPQTVRQECNSFVQQYTPIIIQLLVNGLTPERICTTLGLCTSATVRKPVRAGPQCLMCEFVMREVEQQLGQNATQAQIEAALDQVCNLLPQTVRQECNNFVQQFTPTIIQLLVSGLSPEKVCTTLGLCTQQTVAHRRPGLRHRVPSAAVLKRRQASSTACDVCQTVIQYAKSLLQENATEDEIVQLVERVCSFLPTAEQAACKSFIDQYGPYVIQLLLQDADPKQICQLLGLCTAQPSRSSARVKLLPPPSAADQTLRFASPVRRFPFAANGLVQMVREQRHRAEPIV